MALAAASEHVVVHVNQLVHQQKMSKLLPVVQEARACTMAR